MESPELKAIVYDNQSGAREIAQRALQFLQRAATQSRAESPAQLLDELADLSAKVIRSKPEMPQVFHALNGFLRDAEAREDDADGVGDARMALLGVAQDHLRAHAESLDRVAEHAQQFLHNGDVILTVSRSSTVLAALLRAKKDGKLFDVIAPEGRPLLEGRTLARELADAQVPVRVLVDAVLPTAVEGADRVVVGADAVTHGAFVNKVGTRTALLAARAADVPVIVLAETHKAWTKKADPELGLLTGRQRDPKEVWDAAPHGVEVVNLYFEAAPLDHVRTLVTEDGPLAPGAYWDHVRARGYARRLQALLGDDLA